MSDINNTKELSLKTCNKCKDLKALDQYHKRKQSNDGYGFICKDCILAHVKCYNMKPEVKARKKAYDKALSQTGQYNIKYKARRREFARKYTNLKYKSNPGFRLKHNLRMRIYDALKRGIGAACTSTTELIGCTIPELKKYLESRFQEGMNWENYTREVWHVDHIKPCCTFDLSDPEQQKVCFHYTNLRPLWAKDNLSRPKDGSDIPME